MNNGQITVVLIGLSMLHESDSGRPDFESVYSYGSFGYNLAISTLKASILKAEDLVDRVHVHLIDVDYPYDASPVSQGVLNQVVSLNPDVIGLSCYCWSVDALLELGSRVRERLPNALIVAGGPSAGPVARDLLSAHASLDAVARGEGEPVFLSLCRALCEGASLDTVLGLTWRDATGKARENPGSPVVDLALVPSPYLLGIQPTVSRVMLLDTCRGCKYQCQFCMFMGLGKKLRYVPIEQVEADLLWAVKNGIRSVRFNDGAINYDTDRLRELAAAINRADPNRQILFRYFIRFELLSSEQADILASIPSAEIIVGVDSLTPTARLSMGKGPLSTDYFVSQVKMLQRVGPVCCTLMLGLPGDTVDGLEQTFSRMWELDRDHPGLFHTLVLLWMINFPGTMSHELQDPLGFRCVARGVPYVLESNEHDPDVFLCMARLSAECNYAHTKFMSDCFLPNYLAQDAPAPDRPCVIERRINDNRPCVLLYGDVDANWRTLGLEPYDLRSAWLKAFVEKDDDVRRSYRIELATENEDYAALVAMHRPVWVVRSCLRAPGPSNDWSFHVASSGNKPSVLLVGACSRQEAETWMLAVPQATAATVGEAEIAFRLLLRGCDDVPGLVRRGEGGLVFTGPGDVVKDLDEIPSPFQWHFVRRTGEMIAMQFGRSLPLRSLSSERLFGDLRWAIERRHYNILWLDESLPSDEQLFSRWIGAIRRVDPSGEVLHHLYRLDGTQSIGCLEELSLLPTHALTVTGEFPNPLCNRVIERIASRVVALLDHSGNPAGHPSPVQLALALEPLRRPTTLPGWQLLSTTFVNETAIAEFAWNTKSVVRLQLLWTGQNVKSTLEVKDELQLPEKELSLLQQAVALLTQRKSHGNRWMG